ncbi:glycoside hydrolase family 3 protein [bacterium]|nr:glycoside hydrolase family 3 protein [bacterium]
MKLLLFFITLSVFGFQNIDDIDKIVKNMTIEEKVGQLFNIAIKGKTLLPEYDDFFKKYSIGGVTLFNYNMKSEKQIKSFVDEIQKSVKIPMFISVDQEGGRITRFKNGDFLPPSPYLLGILDSEDITRKVAEYIARDLVSVGINLNLAPVADILSDFRNQAIFDRSFGTTQATVSKHVSIFIEEMQKNGVIAVAKHFPGQGDFSKDTHETLPISKTTEKTMENREWLPFKAAIKKNVGVIMTSHAIYGSLDPKYPATLSEKILKDLLRKKLNYKNLIFTDGLEMKAILDTFGLEKATILAFNSGVDMVTLNWDLENIQKAVDATLKAIESGEIDIKDIDEKVKRVLTLKKSYLFLDKKIKPISKKEADSFLEKIYSEALMFKNLTESEIKTCDIITNISSLKKKYSYEKSIPKEIKNQILILQNIKSIDKNLLSNNIIFYLAPKITLEPYKDIKAVIFHDKNSIVERILDDFIQKICKKER